MSVYLLAVIVALYITTRHRKPSPPFGLLFSEQILAGVEVMLTTHAGLLPGFWSIPPTVTDSRSFSRLSSCGY
jgi:hypothetical protein